MFVLFKVCVAVGGHEPPEQRAVHCKLLRLWFGIVCGCIATSTRLDVVNTFNTCKPHVFRMVGYYRCTYV